MDVLDKYLTPKVRRYLYAIVTALVPILIAYGVVDETTSALWVALSAAVLGTGTAVAHTNTRRDPGRK